MILAKLLFSLMQNSSFRVKWKGKTSPKRFYATKDVKQGGCISAILFACCYDALIKECILSPAGVIMNSGKVSILVYDDDILLFASSPFGLKLLLDITDRFCRKHHDIEINPSKSVILKMGIKGKKKHPISINGISTKPSSKYLGVWLNDEYKEDARLIRTLYSRANNLFRQNTNIKLCSHKTKQMLVNAYGSLYGSEGNLSVSSRVRGAHRYLAKSIFCKEWLKFADLNNDNGWLDIRSRTLYCNLRIRPPQENHRILRNYLVIKSKSSENQVVRIILVNAKTINGSS